MANQFSQNNDEAIKKMLEQIHFDEQVSPKVEPVIMQKIMARKKYNDQIEAYKKRARYGLLASCFVLGIIGIVSTIQIFSNLNGGENELQKVFYISLFSVIGLLFLFMALELSRKGGTVEQSPEE